MIVLETDVAEGVLVRDGVTEFNSRAAEEEGGLIVATLSQAPRRNKSNPIGIAKRRCGLRPD
jgi:hypothetical protein